MERIKIIIFEAGLPMMIVLLLEIFVKLPDYFNIALYIILFSITTALCDKKTNWEVPEKQDWKKVSVCGITGVADFVILLLQKPLMKNIELQTTLQMIMSFLCSVCAVIILCTVLLRWKRKKCNYMDEN